MQHLQLKTQLWPMIGHYHSGKVSPLSLLAFHLHILTSPGNLIDGKAGQYLFRDSGLPLPRAATYDAWRTLLGLGVDESPYFLIPFLPSIRADEEGGVAGSLKGAGEAGSAHLSTLTRKSRLHIRDLGGRISWGSVYVARSDRHAAPLVYELDRSDISESFVVPRRIQIDDFSTAIYGTLRTRMEFLGQFGIPATSVSNIPLKSIRRILFQVLDQSHARFFAESFINAKLNYESDRWAERDDYQQLIHELRDENERKLDMKEEGVIKSTSRKSKKVTFDDIDLSL